MKYSIITQKCGCHLLAGALLRSIQKHLIPDEIIVEDTKFKQYSKSERHGRLMHKEILKARNDYVLLVDHDIMIFDNSLIEQMYVEVSKPNTFACSAFHKLYEGKLLLTEMCAMLNKKMYLDNKIEFDGCGNPCFLAFKEAERKGQKLIKIDGGKRIFHLEAGSKRHYLELLINNIWRSKFENWKKLNNSSANFDDYVVDDGMDMEDLHQLNNIVLAQVNRKIEYKEPFSLIRLGASELKYLDDYFCNKTDLALFNNEIRRKLIEELIENMKNADWIDHPNSYKGIFNDLCDWRSVSERCSEIYTKTNIATYNTNYCSSLQGYLSFTKDFDWSLYKIMEGRRILYIGVYDALSSLNNRRDLKIAKYKYYQLSMSSDPLDRYGIMETFFKDFNPNDWDLVIVSGDLYGRIIIGRIKKLGGRAFDIGQAIYFNSNNIFDKTVAPIENKTFYKIKGLI